jgi:hypothetical protein
MHAFQTATAFAAMDKKHMFVPGQVDAAYHMVAANFAALPACLAFLCIKCHISGVVPVSSGRSCFHGFKFSSAAAAATTP